MTTIARISAAIESVSPLTARQVRDAADDLISHEIIRPGRRGHGAETRDAREGALIVLSAIGAQSARTAGRFAKRLQRVDFVHGSLIDPNGFSEHPTSSREVAALKEMIGKRSFVDTQEGLLAQFRQMRVALSSLLARALQPDLSHRGKWHSALTVDLHVGDKIFADVSAGVYDRPTGQNPTIEFVRSPLVLFELKASFAEDVPVTEPARRSDTRSFDDKTIEALGAVLAG